MLLEQASLSSVKSMQNTWTSEVDPSGTTIWANFGGQNPNNGSAEITKREMDFTAAWNQAYIRVEGIELPARPPHRMLITGAMPRSL